MSDGATTTPTFSMREARSLLSEDDLRPKLWRYWVDLLASWTGMMAGLGMLALHGDLWWVDALGAALAIVLGYRCALFIHELAHQPDREFREFSLAWNLLVGIPFLIPTFVYQTHVEHHRRRSYGTSHDGEYLPFGTRPVWHTLGYLAESFVIPLLAIFRFGVLTPLTWISKPTRDWVYRRASSMIIDPAYVRPLPSRGQLREMRWQEAACFGVLVIGAVGVALSWYGYLPLSPWLPVRVYAIAVAIILLNALRTIGAHRYYYDRVAADDRPMTFTEQLLDSVNYPNRPWLTVLWAPVGLRHHALHHLFPSMPYHALATAHRRLMAGLPADSPYRQTNSPGLGHSLWDLWKRARASRRGPEPVGAEGRDQAAGRPGAAAPG